MSSRWTVLGLAHPRSGWYRELTRWASTAALPIEVVIVANGEEARARLATGRRFSALVGDATHPDLDADLIAVAAANGCATFVVDGGPRRDWRALGAATTLPSELERSVLATALRELAIPVDDLQGIPVWPAGGVAGSEPASGSGRLVSVTGPGGTGTSTVARALAQGLAGGGDDVVLADLALHADQAMAHDVGDVVPGLQELVDAHRVGSIGRDAVRALTWEADHLPYRLLLGLRRHRDWTVLRERTTRAALVSLRRAFDVVVADIDGDLEGEPETGSVDIEDRNRLARSAATAADLVLVVVRADLRGLHRLARLVDDLRRLGVPDEAIVPVLSGAPRRPDRRARLVAAVHEVVGTAPDGQAGSVRPPLHVPWRSDVAGAVHDGAPLPRPLAAPLARAVRVLLDAAPTDRGVHEPEAVVPGSLGSWWPTEEIGA